MIIVPYICFSVVLKACQSVELSKRSLVSDQHEVEIVSLLSYFFEIF